MSESHLTYLTWALVCVAGWAVCLAVGADSPTSQPSGQVRIRFVDPDGQPLTGVTIGRFAKFASPEEVELSLAREPADSGEASEVTLPYGEFVHSRWPPERPVALIAYQPSGRRVGLVEKTLEQIGGELTMTLHPACHVRGRLTSRQLQDLGRRLSWTNVYVFTEGENRPAQSSSQSQRFDLLLPPGKYTLSAYGTDTYDAKKKIEISPGQRELEVELDLPASRLAHLFGKPAPELRSIKGWKNTEPLKLADLKGKVVLLDFWGYWCGPCIHSMPELMKLHEKYANKGVVILAIHDDSVESIAEMDQKLAKARQEIWGGRDLLFAVALDGGGTTKVEGSQLSRDGATTAHYGVPFFPTTLLIDKEGILVPEQFHAAERSRLEAKLDELLKAR